MGRFHVQPVGGQACQIAFGVFRDRFKGQPITLDGFPLGKHERRGNVDIALGQRMVRRGNQGPSQGAHVEQEEANTWHAEGAQG